MPRSKILAVAAGAVLFVVTAGVLLRNWLLPLETIQVRTSHASKVDARLAIEPSLLALVPAGPDKAPAPASGPTGPWMQFTLKASVSNEDGTDAVIEAQPVDGPCDEPRWLDARLIRVQKPTGNLDLRSQATWCLQVAPGQTPAAESLEGRWVTVSDRPLALDAVNRYMRVQHASGRWLGLRVVAAGYCASETSACSGAALVEVAVDDRNLVMPLALSSRPTEVVRLTRAGEPLGSAPPREPSPSTEEPADDTADDTAEEPGDGYVRVLSQ